MWCEVSSLAVNSVSTTLTVHLVVSPISRSSSPRTVNIRHLPCPDHFHDPPGGQDFDPPPLIHPGGLPRTRLVTRPRPRPYHFIKPA